MSLQKIEKLKPFKRFCMSIGELPSSYMESMTYLELLMWLCKYLSETVIPTINNNGQAVEELQGLFIQLQNFVDNYFDNLDVQEEINNKLDEMVEDGTFERVVGDLLVKKLDYFKIDNTITQEELQELLNTENAKVIEFVPGSYNFTNTLRLNSNTKIIMNNCIINNTNKHMFYNFKTTDTEILAYNGSHNIEIVGGKFNACFSFIHGKNIIIKNCDFYHVENDHCMEICGCQNVVVDNCSFEGVKTQPDNRKFVENIQIENANHTNFPWINENSNTFDETPCDSIEIKNCNFKQTDILTYKFYSAIGSHTFTDGFKHNNIIIHNNIFINPLAYCVRLHNTQNIDIFENKILKTNDYMYDRSYPIIGCYNSIDNINIYNNIIDGSLLCIYLADNSNNVSIRNNTFKNVMFHDNSQVSDNYGYILYHRACINLKFNNNKLIDIFGGIIYSLADGDSSIDSSTEFSFNDISYTSDNIENIYSYLLRFYGTKKVVVKGNSIDIPLNKYFIRLHQNVEKAFISNNKINFYNRYIDLNGYEGDLNNVFDIPFVGYTGDSVITENTNIDVNYKNFNKMIVAFGSQASTIIKVFYSLTIGAKLDPRTFNFTIYTSSSDTPVKASLTLNDDGTFIFNCDDTSLKLRRLTFINEF